MRVSRKKVYLFFPYLVYVVSVILAKKQVILQLTNTLGNLSPNFMLIFGLKSQNMVGTFRPNSPVCVRVKEWQAFSSDRVSVNVCCECFIFNHIFNLKDFFAKVKEKVNYFRLGQNLPLHPGLAHTCSPQEQF